MKVLAGTSNSKLCNDIARQLKLKLVNSNIKRFADGEIYIEINENIRGNSIFVVQSTSNPANDNLMELLICIDALRRSSAKNITAVIPYFGYARQDRKVSDRSPITARLICDLLVKSGIEEVILMDIHAGQIQGFFDVPVNHLYAFPIARDYFIKKYNKKNLIIASPDAGGMERARAFAKRSNIVDLAMTDKRRPAPNVAEITNVIGNVKGKYVLLIDDIIDTGGTAAKSAEALIKAGAKGVSMFCTHGVLSGNAIQNIQNSSIDELIITDTINNQAKLKKIKKIRVLSVADLFAKALRRIINKKSISNLFS